MASPAPRRELVGLRPAAHGGNAVPGVIDLSTGVSPLPPPRAIVDAARAANLGRYPHPTALPFRAAAAEAHRLSPDHVVAGAGAVELIWAVARAFAGPARTGLVVTPAFGEYEQALRASGAGVVTTGMRPPRFDLALADLEPALDAARPGAPPISIVFLCRPSNPCLTVLPARDVIALARRWPGTLFVVDEAYQPLFEQPSVLGDEVDGDGAGPLDGLGNLAVLRSLTKVFALPGLRLGYLLAPPAVAAAVQAALPPWNVSSPAQAAGAVAVRLLPAHAAEIRRRIGALRASLARKLDGVAGPPQRSGGPFLLYQLPGAEALAARLREHAVFVRACGSFGLPDHLRIGAGSEDEQTALLRAWQHARGRSAQDSSAR